MLKRFDSLSDVTKKLWGELIFYALQFIYLSIDKTN